MSGAGKTGDRGGGRESTKSLNKSKQTKFKIEVDKKKQREQYMLTRPKFSPFAPAITLPAPAAEGGPPAMIDASCHLLSRSFNRDLIAVMRRAKESGVAACVLHCDWTRIQELMSLVKQWPGQMFATIGVSPDIIKKNNDKVFETRMEQLLDLALTPEVVAVSCGLDLTRDMGTHFLQAKLFSAQVGLARQVRLPLLVSEKAASEQVVEQLTAARNSEGVDRATASTASNPHGKPDPIVLSAEKTAFFPRVAIHNFNGSATDLERFIKADCYIMINGIVCDVKQAGEASSSAAPTQAEQDQAKADKAKRDAEAKDANEEGDEEEEEEEEEQEESETSDGTGFKAQALVGPADLTGAGAHLFHLIRSGLLPLDRLLVSTDAPLHTPQNISDFYIRTSRNEPSNMSHIFTVLSKAYSLPVAEVCEQVFRTSKAFFGLLNQAEAAAEEEKHAEKERAKQAEEKKLVDKHARSEAEARKKAEREKAEAEAALEASAGGKKKNKAAAKQAVAAVASDSDDDGKKKKGGKGGKGGAAKKPASKAADSDEDSDEGWGKQKTKTNLKVQQKKQQQKKKQQKKRNQDSDEESEEEEEEEEKPLPKGKKDKTPAAAPAPAPAAKKAAKKAVSSSDESESESESSEDEKPVAKKKAAAPAAAKGKAKKAVSSSESESESESSSEDEKPAPKKKAAAPAKSKKVVESESSDSDSDSDSDDGVKRSAETIAADRRARAAAIKATQEAAKDRRKLGDDGQSAKGGKAKGGKGGKSKSGAADDEEVDELDDMFMRSNIDGLAAAAAEAQRKLDESKKAAAAAAAASGSLGGGADEETVVFRCRKCQQQLFTHADDLGHRDAAASAQGDMSACEQIFIRRPDWLSEDAVEAAAGAVAADLCCFKCNSKIGRVSVSAPLACACGRLGAGSSPFVSVKMSRIDALTTAATSVRGPRAMDADELDKRKQDEADNNERLRQKEKERLNEKRKVKNASKMPVNNQIGNFTQFRNKSNAPEAAPKKKKGADRDASDSD